MRKIEALKEEESGSGVPDEFLCPITRELMRDPVMAAGGTSSLLCQASPSPGADANVRSTDGYSYERESIESWFGGKNKSSPMTNLPLHTTALTANRSLKMAISRWKSSQ